MLQTRLRNYLMPVTVLVAITVINVVTLIDGYRALNGNSLGTMSSPGLYALALVELVMAAIALYSFRHRRDVLLI